MPSRTLFTFGLLALGAAALPACAFLALSDDVHEIEQASAFRGRVTLPDGETASDHPLLVGLYEAPATPGASATLLTYRVLYGPDAFSFVRESGDYLIAVFEDANQDMTFQPTERVGWHGAPTILEARPGVDFEQLELQLRDPDDARVALPELYREGRAFEPLRHTDRHVGDVVPLDTFREELGPLGMWEPVEHLRGGHTGVFFLEPYDPDKLPVLLVHGISDSGAAWRDVIAGLDRDRHQPWIAQYPSGLRLGMLADVLHADLDELHLRHGFPRLAVVAHSMGGLLARGMVNIHLASADPWSIDLLVTLSTPWAGHAAAAFGVDTAPVVVPSWYDMAPGSPYLRGLFARPLPDELPFELFFSYGGEDPLFGSDGRSDGVVGIASQLDLTAQAAARRLRGFDADHAGILTNADVIAALDALLADLARP